MVKAVVVDARVCVHCAGGLPGPVLFGFVIDHACLLWEQKCDGSTGACLHYDNQQMAWLLLAVCAACKVFNIVCGLAAWQMYVYKHPESDLSQTWSNGQAGNDTTGNCNGSTGVHGDQASAISNLALEAETSGL